MAGLEGGGVERSDVKGFRLRIRGEQVEGGDGADGENLVGAGGEGCGGGWEGGSLQREEVCERVGGEEHAFVSACRICDANSGGLECVQVASS